MTLTRSRTIDSPIGPLTLAGQDETLTSLRMQDQTHPPPHRDRWRNDPSAFPVVVDQLHAYFAGELTEFVVTLRLDGTDFQRRVWGALVKIPYGETRSYGELAQELGHPGAARAVGLANGRNPIGIIVPCHRVIGANGDLTGYGGGLDRKRALLQLERDHTRCSSYPVRGERGSHRGRLLGNELGLEMHELDELAAEGVIGG